MTIEGYENIFEQQCDSDQVCTMSKTLEPFYLYDSQVLPLYDVNERITQDLLPKESEEEKDATRRMRDL